jgi:predicted esterase
MISWDSSPYTEGHLEEYYFGWKYRLNFRLLFPNGRQDKAGWDPNYKPGYPLIVMMHGGGERGNCWGNSCYYKDINYDPNKQPDANITTGQNNNLLNNQNVLLHGGATHLNAVKAAGTKKPNDPTLTSRSFPGFVLFAQSLNTWGNFNASGNDVNQLIRTIRLLCKQYNIDQNRIYLHGLSNGGNGVYNALLSADWLFACAAPMSAINSTNFSARADTAATVPMWFFQGGQDGNPAPAETEAIIRAFRNAGGSARYTLYPKLGHGTWNTAYAEPDFFTWLLSHNKANIHVYYDAPYVCGITGQGAKLGLSYGFLAYQWEKDGQIIPGANRHYYIAKTPGVYRARFSRISANPTEAQWNRWSDPVTIGEVMPEKAKVNVVGSTHLRGLNNPNNTVVLKSVETKDKYFWYLNGNLINIPNNNVDDTVRVNNVTWTNSNGNGAYTLRTSGYDRCLSPPSDPVYLFFANSAPTLPDANIPSTFAGQGLSGSSILLTWKDNSTIERGFEIWRRKAGETVYSFVTRTAEDVVSFIDTNLEPLTQYQYKLRAINNQGRTKYTPGDANVNTFLAVSTLADTQPPLPPQNLVATGAGIGKIKLTWQASPDKDVKQYYIYIAGGDSVATGSTGTTYTLTNLPLNVVYNLTVKAVDFSGNFSSKSNQAIANTFTSGLFYKHSTGAWTTLDDPTLVATWTNPEFTGTVPNFTLAPRTQEDYFNFEFEGYLYINTPGTYQFRTTSDDGSRLALNNVVIVDNNGTHGATTKTSTNQTLAAGPQLINVKYFEYTGGQSLVVQYYGPDTGNKWINIPDEALRSGNEPPAPTPPVAPINLTATGTSMTQIGLTWQYTGGLKVVVLGSSTAEGVVGVTAGQGWVDLLRNKLTSTASGTVVTNLAKGGFDSRSIMPTGSTPAPDTERNITKALSLNPNIIIVNMPSNDIYNNVPVKTMMNNFRAIKKLADAQNVKIFFTTSQPRNDGTSQQRDSLKQSADSIRIAFKTNVIDIYNELTDFSNDNRVKAAYKYSGDQIHLNDAGHQYIYQTTLTKLTPYLPQFEIHRATDAAGPYTMVKLVNALSYTDGSLTPNTTYYYKARTVDMNGTSPFSSVANGKTLGDTQAPTQPTGLQVTGSTFTTVSLVWVKSTDNVLVTGYEIWANGVLLGTSGVNAYLASNLNPNTSYTFSVIAYDASGNKSAASSTVNVVTSNPDIYYSKSTGALNDLTTWGKNADGSGSSPAGFSTNGQYLVVQNRTSADVAATWNVEGSISKVIIGNGVTVSINNPFSGRLEVQDGGVVNINNTTAPDLISLAPTSTVNYGPGVKFVQQKTYGNLSLTENGSESKVFYAGTTTVTGNLTVSGNTMLKGADGNTSKIVLSGDLIFNDAPSALPSDFGLTLECVKAGTQTITSAGNFDLYALKLSSSTTVNLNNGTSPFAINLGSAVGGGISLANGSKLSLGGNTLTLSNAATINSAGETGVLATNGATINITSSSSATNNLYFDANEKSLKYLGLNTSASKTEVNSPVSITDAIKIKAGELSANGNITLVSNATSTANIQEIEGNGKITGNVKVQRYINSKNARLYRYLSSSVEGVTIAKWQAYFPITGPFTGASSVPGTSSSASSVFYYDEPTGWRPYPVTTNAAPIEKGRGYSAYMYNGNTSVTMETSGNPYQGDVTFTMDGNTTGTNGWNLLGNPYASTIAWSNNAGAWIKSNVSSVVAVTNNTSATAMQFMYYDANTGLGGETGGLLQGGRIAPGQAFWVQASNASPSLTITEKAKSTGQQTLYRENENPVNHLKINLQQGGKTDPTYVAFTEYGTDAFDEQVDGIKQKNTGMFNLSTWIGNNVDLAINNMSDAFCDKNIQLNLQNVSAGSYSFTFEKLETIDGIQDAILTDNFTKTTQNILQNNLYTFAVTTDASSYGRNRFTIKLTRGAVDLSIQASAANVCESSALVTLNKTQAGVQYTIVNNNNEAISETVAGTGDAVTITVPKEKLSEGSNAVKISAGYKGCSTQTMSTPVNFTYSKLPVVTVSALSSCQGSNGFITVGGASQGGSYRWYDNEMNLIKGVSGPSLETDELYEPVDYYVSAVNANGCEGPMQIVSLYPQSIDAPVIEEHGETLSTVAQGNLQWFKDGEVLQGETGASIRPSNSGVYTVTTSIDGCTKTSEARELIITGTEVSGGGAFSVVAYPNPTSHQDLHVRVQSSKPGDLQVKMIDLVGRQVYSRTVGLEEAASGMRVVPTGQTPAGIYFLTVEQHGQLKKIKIVIKD